MQIHETVHKEMISELTKDLNVAVANNNLNSFLFFFRY